MIKKVSRLWRLETEETYQTIERLIIETIDDEDFPLQIRGRVLKDEEELDKINVAETDVLIYEYAMDHKKPEFAFTPQ